MPNSPRDRDDLHIEIYVSRESGDLSISSYSDVRTRTLDQAIAEAETFIAHCRAIQADIAEPGIGACEPSPPVDPHAASRAWDAVIGRRGDGQASLDNLFSSKTLFQSLTR